MIAPEKLLCERGRIHTVLAVFAHAWGNALGEKCGTRDGSPGKRSGAEPPLDPWQDVGVED